jgi:hypothetical protein
VRSSGRASSLLAAVVFLHSPNVAVQSLPWAGIQRLTSTSQRKCAVFECELYCLGWGALISAESVFVPIADRKRNNGDFLSGQYWTGVPQVVANPSRPPS